MAKEAGKEYNPESASHLRPRKFAFQAAGFEFRYTLEIPQYILDRLDSAAMDALQTYMSHYAYRVVTDSMRGGYFHTTEGETRMRRDVGQHLREYIWNEFAKSQERAGQDCWEVAPSLQRVSV